MRPLLVQNEGLIPCVYAIFHTMAFLCHFGISNRLSFWRPSRSEVMITGSFELLSKKAHSRWLGRFFNSNSKGSSIKGFDLVWLLYLESSLDSMTVNNSSIAWSSLPTTIPEWIYPASLDQSLFNLNPIPLGNCYDWNWYDLSQLWCYIDNCWRFDNTLSHKRLHIVYWFLMEIAYHLL